MASNHFSEVDMMILAQLSYFDPPGQKLSKTGKIDKPLESMLTDPVISKDLEEKFGKSQIDLLLDKVGSGHYTISKTVNDRDGTGFSAFAITGPDPKTVTIAARGTEGFAFNQDSMRDVLTDAQLGVEREANQQRKMDEFMAGMENYDNIYLTGHSLGGNLAASGAIHFLFPDKIKGVNTYNSPGFNTVYVLENKSSIEKIRNKVVNYQNEGDAISDLMTPVGQVTVVESTLGNGWLQFLQNHSLNATKVEKSSFVVVEEGKRASHYDAQFATFSLTTVISLFKYAKTQFLQDFVPSALNKVSIFFRDVFLPGSRISAGPVIKIDTFKLRTYAQRLQNVNKRLSSLDKKLDALYAGSNLIDLFYLIQADLMTSGSWKIKQMIAYIEDTAYDFEMAEKVISQNV